MSNGAFPTCIYCGKTIHYWPNCSPRTASDYNNVEWVIPRGSRRKRYFHRTCFTKEFGLSDSSTDRHKII